MDHELKYRQNGSRPFWYCSCCVAFGGKGPGWVCYITQPRGGGQGGKPKRPEAERLHARHVEDAQQPEEAWF